MLFVRIIKKILERVFGPFLKSELIAKVIAVAILFLIIFAAGVLTFWGIQNWQIEKARQRVQEAKTQVLISEQEAREIRKQADADREAVKQAEAKVKKAKEEHLEAVAADSGTHSDDFELVKQQFCELYPGDSKCN